MFRAARSLLPVPEPHPAAMKRLAKELLLAPVILLGLLFTLIECVAGWIADQLRAWVERLER